MLEIFTNPGYLAVGGALISAPIIIHLINRMRFKRIAWAAMEFLLKAQKRMRRRLIIEQLLLLMLRCFLVALACLLVARFVGFSFAELGSKQSLHLVLLDDTLSMKDEWKEGDEAKDAFGVAKKDLLLNKIVRSISQASASDRLIVVPLSQLATDKDFQPAVWDRLNDGGRLKELEDYLNKLPCSQMHVPMIQAINKAKEYVGNYSENQVTLHVLGDFRNKDWSLQDGEAVHKELVDLANKHRDLKIRLLDTVHPYRTAGQGLPLSHDNIAITDLRAATRIVGKDMPVSFTVTLANYSAREVEVNVVVYDDVNGKEMPQVDFNPPMPLKVAPSSQATTSFDLRFSPNIKAGETHFAQISCRLETPQRTALENDGLAQDNVRHAAVEVREKVPVLIIDGEGQKGRAEGRDSFYLQRALISVPGASYDVLYGDELGGGVPAKALERPDLHQFPTIFLLNVRELTKKQLSNLEAYVRDGGGVGFFLGPQVSAPFYNKELYRGGNGLFPVPLKDTYFPAPNDEPLEPAFTGNDQLVLRDDLFGDIKTYPLFGPIFRDDTKVLDNLKYWPIKRYFPVPRSEWKPEPGRVFELAALPNEAPIKDYQGSALAIVRDKNLEKVLDSEDYRKYRKGFERHRLEIERLIGPGSDKKAYHLAFAIKNLLTDQGQEKNRTEFPNLTEFWANSDPVIQGVKKQAIDLRDKVQFGDPFVVALQFGQGKVCAVMTTAGKDWNELGILGLYQAMVWEMQNYLSSQSLESALTVGSPVQATVDNDQLKAKRQLKMMRTYYKPEQGKAIKPVKESDQFVPEGKGQQTFTFDKNLEPGLYVTQLYEEGNERKPLSTWGHVFNVDAAREGQLLRVSWEDIETTMRKANRPGQIEFHGPDASTDKLVQRKSDLSESPWFFLLFIGILVCEQALAVHLSFHLKGKEHETMLPAAARGAPARVAA